MTDQSTLRQRKKTSNKKKKAAEKKEDVAPPPPTATNEDSNTKETLSETFFKHPLVRVFPFVLIPYIVWNAIYFITLQRPDIISRGSLGLINLRPALEPQDERQVLILGAEIAENRYVTEAMAKSLDLEIVHEAFDAKNYFCRDGSVSWFQIMRFLEPLNDVSGKGREFDNKNQVAQLATWKALCVGRNTSLVEGFHPNQYEPSSTCSSRDKWSGCWAKECLETINSLWGCAWNEDKPCKQQFSKVLHQVRHPIRAIELLNSTLCSNENLKPSFMGLVKGWFLNRDWDSLSCLEAMAWYEIDFQNTLIKARDAGLVHGVFQIEKTSPCEVATQAGFLDEFSAVYGPNAAKTSKLCHDESSLNSDPQSPYTFTKFKKKSGVKIPGYDKLTFEDFEGGKHGSQLKAGDMTLVNELKKLVSNLGYDREEDSEFL
jgi:hypothetical protein